MAAAVQKPSFPPSIPSLTPPSSSNNINPRITQASASLNPSKTASSPNCCKRCWTHLVKGMKIVGNWLLSIVYAIGNAVERLFYLIIGKTPPPQAPTFKSQLKESDEKIAALESDLVLLKKTIQTSFKTERQLLAWVNSFELSKKIKERLIYLPFSLPQMPEDDKDLTEELSSKQKQIEEIENWIKTHKKDLSLEQEKEQRKAERQKLKKECSQLEKEKKSLKENQQSLKVIQERLKQLNATLEQIIKDRGNLNSTSLSAIKNQFSCWTKKLGEELEKTLKASEGDNHEVLINEFSEYKKVADKLIELRFIEKEAYDKQMAAMQSRVTGLISKATRYVGLPNSINGQALHCWMNAAIQALRFTPSFMQLMQEPLIQRFEETSKEFEERQTRHRAITPQNKGEVEDDYIKRTTLQRKGESNQLFSSRKRIASLFLELTNAMIYHKNAPEKLKQAYENFDEAWAKTAGLGIPEAHQQQRGTQHVSGEFVRAFLSSILHFEFPTREGKTVLPIQVPIADRNADNHPFIIPESYQSLFTKALPNLKKTPSIMITESSRFLHPQQPDYLADARTQLLQHAFQIYEKGEKGEEESKEVEEGSSKKPMSRAMAKSIEADVDSMLKKMFHLPSTPLKAIKLKDPIDIGKELSVPFDSGEGGSKLAKLHLTAFIAHEDNGTPSSGHYTCYALGDDGKWRCYNDDTVTLVSETILKNSCEKEGVLYFWS